MTDKDAGNQPDAAALQVEVQKLKDQKQALEAENVNFKKTYGWIKDPEAARANLEAYEQLRKEGTGGDPKKIEALIADKEKELKGVFGGKITELEGQVVASQKELKTLRVTNVAMQEAAKHFNADGLPLLQQVIDATTDWVDGKVVVMEGGKPRVSAKDPRQNMELPEYMGILAAQYPSLAKSEATSGGKPNGTAMKTTAGSISKTQYLAMSEKDRVDFLNTLQPAERKTFFNSVYSN